MDETIRKIIMVVSEHIGNKIDIDNIDDKLTDLGMDSIQFIRIVVELEELFEIEIPDEKLIIYEMDTIRKIDNIIRLSMSKIENKDVCY